MRYLVVNLVGGIQQMEAIVTAAIVLVVGLKLLPAILKSALIGAAATLLVGGIAYMVIGTTVLKDLGDTLFGMVNR
jgi:hypothetical protein